MKKKLFIVTFLLLSIFLFTGKIYAESLTAIGYVTTNGSNLNIRTTASTNSTVISQVNNKQYVTIISSKNSFYYIEYDNNKYGYVSSAYISKINTTQKTVKTNGSVLNVRSGAGTGYYVVKQLPNNTAVHVISTTNGWSKIVYNGSKVGYCSSSYLTSKNNINLNVTSYKQYDSRWASATIVGNKTMQQIGCLTTALSMTESYRTGTVITPLMMKNNSSYTSSGSIYWPSNYKFITSNSNYLANIQSLLTQGKPVIIGCKNSSGGQHWVVVRGYSGDALTPSSFYINDPGSSSRYTLADFLATYPTFYKIAYY